MCLYPVNKKYWAQDGPHMGSLMGPVWAAHMGASRIVSAGATWAIPE